MNRTPRLCALLLALCAGPALGVLPPDPSGGNAPLPDWDVRGIERMSLSSVPTHAQLEALRPFLRHLPGAAVVPPTDRDLVVRWGPQPGTLHQLFRRGGYLSEPAPGRDAESVAREFVGRHRALFGLPEQAVKELGLARRMTDPGSGATHLLFEQKVEGIPVFLGQVRVSLDRHGRVVSLGGDTAPHAVRSAEVALSPAAALAAAAASVCVTLDAAPPVAGMDEGGRVRFDTGPFESEPWVDPVWFPHDDGLVRAWQVTVDPVRDQGWYQVVVDAATGEPLSRHDLVENVATEGLAFREDPGQGPQILFPFVDDTVVTDPTSPDGWSAAGETEGNNCDVKEDFAADNEATIGARAVANGTDPLSFDFVFTDNPPDDTNASMTHLFWLNNWLHDRLARMGFDEAAGNFQDVNYTGQGLGGDRVRVDCQDGAGVNNASMGTPPDGAHPRMTMLVWTFTNPNRDSGFDSSVVTHELFHGVSNRLITGGGSAGCLGGPQGGAMGEGWSDFFPCSFWDQPTVGGYLINNYVRGIRRAAYDDYPYDYGQLCNQGGFEVHRDGEIWSATLWDIRELFMQKYGTHEGRCRTERLVLDGMKLSPCRPTFVDMRDAILLAGQLHGLDGDVCLLWEGFAGRGLGIDAERAAACTNGQDVTSYDVPPECADCAIAGPAGAVADTSSPNEVTVRFTPSPDADEHVLLRSPSPCPGPCFEAEFVEVARGAGDATELRDVDADGNRLSEGQTYSYRVMALKGTACTAASECLPATITGRCTMDPGEGTRAVAGVTRLQRPPDASCSMTVEWGELEARCGDPGSVRYNVYRSTDPAFEPGPENLIASVAAPDLTYQDVSVPPAEVTYVVRAEDLTTGGEGPHGGNEESNEVRLTRAPQGEISGTTTFSDDAEAGELPGYLRTGNFQPNDWQVLSDGSTRGGSAWHVTGQEGGTADKNLHLPPLSLGSSPRFLFQHIFDFENRFDGGVIEISTDGGVTWTDLLDDFVAGGYDTSNGSGFSWTVGGLINPPNTNEVWTGENASGFGNYDPVEVDLSPYADVLDAQLRFRCLLDPLTFDPGGWYVDDIQVEDVLTFDACADPCAAPPQAALADASACAMPGEAWDAPLDASGSIPGSAAFAQELGFVFTHDGPGDFAGKGWAEGPLATLSFPPGTPAGDYPVTLTVRGEDGCSGETSALVTLVEGTAPPGPVGSSLRVRRTGTGLELTWDEVGATGYNVHAVGAGSDLTAIAGTPVAASSAGGVAVLDSGLGLPGSGMAFLKVYAATSCGDTVP